MNNQRNWEILGRIKKSKNQKINKKEIIDILLHNRGIRTKKQKQEFFNPPSPEKLSLRDLGINPSQVKKAIERIKKARKTQELVIVYGDYDADGICGTAILWERLYSLGLNVLPYIPERFSEGYGLNLDSLKALKKKSPNLGLIITVDHGIVAAAKIETAKKLGIDIIITDHHEPGKVKPKCFALIHTTRVGGAAVAWILSREIKKSSEGLDLVAIGTVADQLPLTHANRSFVRWGLEALNATQRLGLNELFEEAGIAKGEIGPYEIGFIIAPRINAMGRLVHAIDSLRLLCTKNRQKAKMLAGLVNKTNLERQRIVEEVVVHAKGKVGGEDGIIILSHESYHEGVIGLAAARLVEEFYRPAIVISVKGGIAKASARSISGFNIIETLRKVESFLLEGGGHPMAAGFSIESGKIEEFSRRINKIASPLLTKEILTKKLKIDMEIDFSLLNKDLLQITKSFEPTGLGNPTPTFVTRNASILEARAVGREGGHLKLKLAQEGKELDAIAFKRGELLANLSPDKKVDVVYLLEENTWNSMTKMELKIKDIKISS